MNRTGMNIYLLNRYFRKAGIPGSLCLCFLGECQSGNDLATGQATRRRNLEKTIRQPATGYFGVVYKVTSDIATQILKYQKQS